MEPEATLPNHWKHAYEDLRHWFQTPLPTQTVSSAICYLLTGSPGVGKTTFLTRFAADQGAHIQWITPDKCESSKEFLQQLNKYMYPTVDTTFDGIDTHRVFIGIDSWDILITNDRNMFATLHQFLTSNRTNPYQRRIVCICDRSVEKKFSDIHPPVKQSTLKPMSDTDICFVLKRRFPTLHLGIVTQISDACQNNLNTAIEMAQFESSSVASASASAFHTEVQKVLVLSEVDVLPTLSQLYVPKPVDDWYRLFSQDPWMYPLRFHENLLKELEQRDALKSLKIKAYDHCLSALVVWDQWMSRTLKDDETAWMDSSMVVWSLAAFTHVDTFRRVKTPKYSDASMMEFTKLLSQLSLQKKNAQNTFQTFRGSRYPIYEYPSHWFCDL